MGGRRKTPPLIPAEEFSVEIGDVNGIKIYEPKRGKVKNRAMKEK